MTLDLVLILHKLDSRAVTQEVAELSELTRAARTSGGSEDQASRIDFDKVVEANLLADADDASSLQ